MHLPEPVAKTIGIFFIILGVILFALSAGWYAKPEKKVSIKSLESKAFNDCDSVMKKYGFSGIVRDTGSKTITGTISGLSDWEEKMLRADFVIQSCPEFRLEQFCFGKACKGREDREISGLLLSLKSKITG